MTIGYKPTTARVREGYIANEVNLRGLPLVANHTGPFVPAFDRWLAEVKAEAWQEGYSHLFDAGREFAEDVVSLDDNPYREAGS